MEEHPLVSIIIPCYNHGQFLEEAVSSALNQTYKPIEVVVVNDGSTDRLTKEVFQKLEQNFSSIKFIHHDKNKGLPATRNTAIHAASGEYILPLDADDTIEPTFVEKTAIILNMNPEIGFVAVGQRWFGDENYIHIPPHFNFHTLLHQNILAVTSLFRKKAWEQVGGFNETFIYGYEDWEFWLNLAKNGWEGFLVPEPLFNYRKHGKSMINDAVKKHSYIVNQIQTIHKDLYLQSSQQFKNKWQKNSLKNSEQKTTKRKTISKTVSFNNRLFK